MDNALVPGNVRDETLARLMASHGNAVLRMCYLYLKDVSWAEDAAQDTFIKAYKALDRFTAAESCSEKAWLMRIAINTCKDYRRSTWFRHVDRHVAAEDVLHAVSGLSLEEQTLLEEVKSLAPKYKDAILLYYYQGLSVQEMSHIMGVSASTIYARLNRAQAKLRVKLERGNQDE